MHAPTGQICRRFGKNDFAVLLLADIYEWELDFQFGYYKTSILTPDGAGLVPAPGLNAANKNLTKAFLEYNLSNANLNGANLMDAYFGDATLTSADFSGANLAAAKFDDAILTNADFTNADVRGTEFYSVTDSGFTSAQLYSTASYQAGDLTGIYLRNNDLTGWNFVGKNLTDADFKNSTLTSANFTNADVRGTRFDSVTDSGFTSAQLYSTASYQASDLTDVYLGYNDLTGWNFAGKNLTNTDFRSATLTIANFTNTDVRGTRFNSTTDSGFTSAQLYSTASYQAGDLTDIFIGNNDLTGWNFAGKNLTNADFRSATLTSVDFSGANLSDAVFYNATLASTDLTGADAREVQSLDTSSAVTHNFIHPDGHIAELDIMASEVMRLWDFNLSTPVPILVEDAMSIAPTGTLRAVFEDDDWGSTLTFEAGIGVSLDGTLELLVDSREGSNVSNMVGVTFDLFDWTGVAPTGAFTQISTDGGLVWDTSDLYTTGEVTLLSAPSVLLADFDDNGVVDEADYDLWRASFGSTTNLDADGNGNGVIDAADYTVWRDIFSNGSLESAAVPEPSTVVLAIVAFALLGSSRGKAIR